MKKLLAYASLLATLTTLAACASTGGFDPFTPKVTPSGPINEMTKGACCLKPADPSQ